MRSFLAAVFISAFFLTSCNNSSHSDIDTSLPAFTNTTVSSDTNQLNQSDLNLETPALQSVQQAPSEVSKAAGLNPPHGQPGHDCAIAVGAPLNGSPASKAAPVSAPAINFSAPTPSPAATSGGQRLNPPHGQPGHDCAVQVGAPLG